MNIHRFLERNHPSLQNLEAETFLQRKLSNKASLTQIMSYDYIYRKALAIYATARHRFPNTEGTRRVADLVADSHSIIYKDAIRKENFKRIISYRLFRSVYEVKSILWFAVAIELLGLIAGILWAVLDPSNAKAFVEYNNFSIGSNHGAFYQTPIAMRVALASQIFTHNIGVAIVVFLGGFILGIPTVFVLIENSVLIGVLGAYEFKNGGGEDFIRLVLPHGLLELSLITLASVAGFRVAKVLVVPTNLSRMAEFSKIINPVVDTLGLACMVLVISGFVEAMVTTYYLNLVLAIVVSLSLAGGFWFLIIYQGRKVPIEDRVPIKQLNIN